MTDRPINNIEYTRRLYQNVLDWYGNADSKAQVVLAIDGGLLAFVSSTVFSKPEDVRAILDALPGVTWILLVCMVISLMVSMGASICCLWARIYSERNLTEIINRAVEKAEASGYEDGNYPPTISCFFQFIERLDKERFRETLNSVNAEFEIEALASSIHILSGNVRKKHFAVNIGFISAAAALVLFFASAASYALLVN
jgi:hypothetical protein